MGREDLIGNGKHQLVPRFQPRGMGKAPEGKRVAHANRSAPSIRGPRPATASTGGEGRRESRRASRAPESMSKHAARRARLREHANPEIAAHSARFFKTGPAGYAAGDRFLGVRVPAVRSIAREFRGAPLAAALTLLRSQLHEERLLALVLMVDLFERGDDAARAAIYAQYLKHDAALREQLGSRRQFGVSDRRHASRRPRDRRALYDLARSASLWERRVAIIGDVPVHQERLVRRHAGDRETAAERPRGSDPQGHGLDAARGRQSRRAVEERFLREHYPRCRARCSVTRSRSCRSRAASVPTGGVR